MEWRDAIRAFGEALDRLKEALAEQESALIRDAAIKRFEFTFELGWKAIQRFLQAQGLTCRSPKGCFQEAFAFGLIQDDPLWIRMIEDRNQTVHTYNQRTAQRIYSHLKDYVPLYDHLFQSLTGHLDPP